MDHSTLVAPALTPEMIAAGEGLVRALDNAGVQVVAALWLSQNVIKGVLIPDAHIYRLLPLSNAA
jgi:hypothetical protein